MTYLFVGLFLFLMGYIVYFNVVKSKEIINSPYNPRLDSMADRVVRGTITDRAGNVLAQTHTGDDGTESRYYPYANLYAHVVGYSDQGKAGLESSENFELLTSNAFFPEKLKKEFKDEKNIGDTVVTTLDTGLQQAAYQALGANNGAVVIMEPGTGKILAMVSKPDYDPNTVSQNWEWLSGDANSSLLNRATQGQYAPGSVMKLVTTLEYMREAGDVSGYLYNCTGEITHDGTTIPCANHSAHGQVDLAASFAFSCNSSFCNIGLSLNVNKYRETAKELLFDSRLPSELPYSRSRFRLKSSDSSADKMMTAMGQGETLVSPYHMALITCAVANGGVLMEPYLVDRITNYTGTTVRQHKPQKYAQLMSSSEAMQIKEYMKDAVEYGTASVLSGQGYSAAGKTGTAEYGSKEGLNHSWFIGFYNPDNPELVISAVVEETDGGTKAVNVAKAVFDSYYGSMWE